MTWKIFFSDSDESSPTSMEPKTEHAYNAEGEDIPDSQLTEFYEYRDSEK